MQSMFKPAAWLSLCLSLACTTTGTATTDGGTDGNHVATTPTVLSNAPLSGATGVALNVGASVVFSEPMDVATVDGSSFTLAAGTQAVAGTVIYANAQATFWPAAHLASNTTYTATVSTGAKSTDGVALAASHVWSFTTGTTVEPGLPVSLGQAGNFVILAKSAISTVPTSAITGNIALSPAAASFITGFSLAADATNVFATSPQITGKAYAADYAVPTPANLTAAVADMQLAFTDAAGRAPGYTEIGAGNIGGMTLAPGVYKWSTGLLIPGDVTVSGSATDVWIFQVAQDLTVSSGAKIVLAGGALAKNIVWQVGGKVDVGTTAHVEGVVLAQTAITLHTGAGINGRLMAQTMVSIDGSTIVAPAP